MINYKQKIIKIGGKNLVLTMMLKIMLLAKSNNTQINYQLETNSEKHAP